MLCISIDDLASSLFMVGRDIPGLLARFFCSHRRSMRAARTCSLVISESFNGLLRLNTPGIDVFDLDA
jgi:hypothetical protein